MNYNPFFAPSYDGSDPSFNMARFLQPSPYSTNGQGSENARAQAPQPTNSKNKCYKRNNKQTNKNHQGNAGQNLGSGKGRWRRRGNRHMSDSWGCSPSHPDGAFRPGQFHGQHQRHQRSNDSDSHRGAHVHQGPGLDFTKDRPLLRRQSNQVDQRFEDSFAAGQGRRSHGRQRYRNRQNRKFTQFDDQVVGGYEGRSGHRGPELAEPYWQPCSSMYGSKDSEFDPFSPQPHPDLSTAPEIYFVYRDFDGDIDMSEAPPLEPDPWQWYNLQRLLT